MVGGFIGRAVATGRRTTGGVYLVVIKRQDHGQPRIIAIIMAGPTLVSGRRMTGAFIR
jgi:hypothetical protein